MTRRNKPVHQLAAALSILSAASAQSPAVRAHPQENVREAALLPPVNLDIQQKATKKPVAAPAPRLDLLITLEIALPEGVRSRRPYVAVWVEDANRNVVRTIALWASKPRYIEDLRTYYHDARLDNMDMMALVSTSSATRSPGKYTLRWNGLNDAGKPVPPGRYTIGIEAAREHGTYQLMHQEINFDGKTVQHFTLPGGTELAGATLDYSAHEPTPPNQ